jgi:hypothetical protein
MVMIKDITLRRSYLEKERTFFNSKGIVSLKEKITLLSK